MAEVIDIFESSKVPRDITKYTLLRGVPDFANAAQFQMFETGYSWLVVVGIPKFLEKLAEQNSKYESLIKTYIYTLENEFKGLEGIEDLTIDTGEVTNGIAKLEMITKVNKQTSGQFSMNFYERSGTILTKVHELYLTGIKDGITEIKNYHGLLDMGLIEAGPENEMFKFFYIVTDNTGRNIERAYYIASAQPTKAPLSDVSNSTKGTIEFKEISLEFNGYLISGPKINAKAVEFLTWIRENTILDESQMDYTGVSDAAKYELA